jgi:hypothetical protein
MEVHDMVFEFAKAMSHKEISDIVLVAASKYANSPTKPNAIALMMASTIVLTKEGMITRDEITKNLKEYKLKREMIETIKKMRQ